MKRGVSLYSYQQSQFFKESNLESQLEEVANNLNGATGIELIDEMSLQYPVPDPQFMKKWYGMIEQHNLTPVAMDVSMDVLQFRDHVMSYDECAERLRHEISLAKMLGFSNVRVLSIVPLEILIKVLPYAEALDIKIGKEIHQPMSLEGRYVYEIVEFAEKHNTEHLGIVPDFGIFGTRPSEAILDGFIRRGAAPESAEASVALSGMIKSGDAPFKMVDVENHTAGNVRSSFTRYINTGECIDDFKSAFAVIKDLAEKYVKNPTALDYSVVAEGIMLSNTSAKTLGQLAKHVTHIHAKFNNMTEIPGKPGQYQDIAIDYENPLRELKKAGYTGYLNSEYEGQRYFQDQMKDKMMDEFEQVRRHQEMLARLIG